MQNLKPKTWIILTVAVGIVASILVYRYLNQLQQVMTNQETIVVAAMAVPEGTRLSPTMVKTAQVPAKYVHPQAVREVDKAVGMYTTAKVVPDEPLLTGKLASENVGSELPFTIPKGKRAVSIEVNPVSGVAGLIKPGYRVDMLISFKLDSQNSLVQAQTLLQNIQVLAVGSELQKKEGAQETETITLAVSPQEAEWVMLVENTGKIKMALRPSGEEGKNALKPVNLKGLAGTGQ